MADINLLLQNYGGQDDDQDEDDYSKYYESTMLDQGNPDDLLTPLEKLRKYCTSENIFTRQMVARSIVETVQSITNEKECLSLLEIITKLSDDIEPSVRCELMEQLPPCCMMIMDLRLVPDAISGFVLPVMVKYLTDPNNQVRKLSQNALLQLMDQDLIYRDDVETQICPVLLQLTEPESGDDFRTEAVALMTKITPLIGGEVTEKLFLERFGDLCADPLFHVRKVCASNFGDMSSVVRQVTTETYLLPLFARLCEDGVWGVRKACAETFMAVSGTCSRDVKYQNLSPLFVGLLCDKSRWVQMAAYQALGQFIATFADPCRTGFEVNEDGNLVPCDVKYTDDEQTSFDIFTRSGDTQTSGESSNLFNSSVIEDRSSNSLTSTQSDSLIANNEPCQPYSSFEYWRTPIPNLDVLDDTDTACSKTSTSLETSKSEQSNTDTSSSTVVDSVKEYVVIDSEKDPTSEDSLKLSARQSEEKLNSTAAVDEEKITDENPEETASEAQHSPEVDNMEDEASDSYEEPESDHDRSVSPHSTVASHSHDELFGVNSMGSIHSEDDDENDSSNLQTSSMYASSLVDEESLHNQKIVPPALLEHYISMTEPSKAQTIDGELPRHCAFTLPGVVLALGRDNWHLLKETYDLLSTDMQWKVRRTLAFSIHDLALILGQDICVADLVPVFNGFLKDLDEVRVGVLKHLFDFIDILPMDIQKDYLHVFNDFLKTDNMRNWRFRQDLAHQLMSLVNLYDVEELAEHVCPISLELVCDKVADVREYSFHLLCILVQKLCQYDNNVVIHKFATNLITLATHHQHWVKRKACAQIYLRFLEGNWYDVIRFSKDFLPSLINLCTDVVPNIRLIASKALLAFMRTELYQNQPESDDARQIVDRTLEALQLDDDRDVRYFSGGKVEERVSSNSVIYSDELFTQSGVRIIQRGIHEYALNDDDDDDTELVEEVYIEEQPNNGNQEEIVVEEYYVESEDGGENDYSGNDAQVYVEEIVDEVIEHIGSTT